jgi:hypothetical protein
LQTNRTLSYQLKKRPNPNAQGEMGSDTDPSPQTTLVKQ